MWCPNGAGAGIFVLFATVDPERKLKDRVVVLAIVAISFLAEAVPVVAPGLSDP